MTKLPAVKPECKPEKMKAEDPLFILYTSGSTGKPKGVLHTTGGYLVYASMTHQYVFDYHDGDIYWCTADVGWVTGHSYIVYGPLANGATTLMFEGVPNYPSVSRFWEVIDKHKVNIFYTAPTAIRALMSAGDEPVKKTSRKSLRILGSVGEPINPEAWEWYYQVVGDKRSPIVDTWWQTETGGILITPLARCNRSQARLCNTARSSACNRNWSTMKAMLLRAQPTAISASPIHGRARCAPSTAITSASSRPISPPTRASTSPATAVAATRMVITGSQAASMTSSTCPATAWERLKSNRRWSSHDTVSGSRRRRLSARSQGPGHLPLCHARWQVWKGTDELRKELVTHVRKEIGPIASPDKIQFAPGLPKTRSGKIMRRILRKIAEDDFGALGDTSTLADPAVVDDLIANRQNKKG